VERRNQIGLHPERLRRMKFVGEQFFLAARCPEHQATREVSRSDDNRCLQKCPGCLLPSRAIYVVLISQHRREELTLVGSLS